MVKDTLTRIIRNEVKFYSAMAMYWWSWLSGYPLMFSCTGKYCLVTSLLPQLLLLSSFDTYTKFRSSFFNAVGLRRERSNVLGEALVGAGPCIYWSSQESSGGNVLFSYSRSFLSGRHASHFANFYLAQVPRLTMTDAILMAA